jgi:hypothetical protein
MALNPDEICIKGDKYRIVETGAEAPIETGTEYVLEPDTGTQQGEQPQGEDMGTLESKLDKIIDILGDGSTNGGYRSVNITLQPREQKYQIMFGLYANQLHIRSDQGLTINLNSKSGEDIFVEVMEFPFSLSELPRNAAVHTIYLTTGANITNIKILAIGDVS